MGLIGYILWDHVSHEHNSPLILGSSIYREHTVHGFVLWTFCHNITPSVPKWLSYFLIFCPKLIVQFIHRLEIWGSKSYIFVPNLLYQKILLTHKLPGAFQSSCFFLSQASYLQLLDQCSPGLNLAKVRNINNHFGMEGLMLWYVNIKYIC